MLHAFSVFFKLGGSVKNSMTMTSEEDIDFTLWQRQLKAGTVAQNKTSFARQWHGKHIFAAMNQNTTTEELLEVEFSLWSVPRLYIGDLWEKSVS
jgi:hypothetical protein